MVMEFNTASSLPAIGSVISHSNNNNNNTNGKPNVVSSMSYHPDGHHLFVATEQNSTVTLIDAIRTGQAKGSYSCDREGVSVVTATHDDYCVLSAGNKQNTIQYWSLYDNKILRKFRGHTSSVHELSMSPTDDMFLSSSSSEGAGSSSGNSVRLWNLQQAGCMAKLDLQQAGAISAVSSPKAAFDHTGMIFSIMAAMPNPQEGNYVHLYDARNYSGGAFAEFKLTTALMQEAMKTHQVTSPPPGPLSFTNIDFNLSGDRVLLQSREGLAVVLDGFEGTIQRIFQPSSNTTNSSSIGVSSCFTPDGKSMLMGNTTGTIDVYDLQSGTVVKQLEVVNPEVAKVHPEAATITALTCNPKYQQIASSSTDTCLWIW